MFLTSGAPKPLCFHSVVSVNLSSQRGHPGWTGKAVMEWRSFSAPGLLPSSPAVPRGWQNLRGGRLSVVPKRLPLRLPAKMQRFSSRPAWQFDLKKIKTFLHTQGDWESFMLHYYHFHQEISNSQSFPGWDRITRVENGQKVDGENKRGGKHNTMLNEGGPIAHTKNSLCLPLIESHDSA